MSLAELFEQDIPLHEAASFYVGLKKTAEWTDPPDMTGTLEGQFNVPVEQVLDKLKSIISMKFRKMVAWYTYAQCFRDHGWRAAKIEFFDHAMDEQEDATFYVKRAVALGGPVHMDPIDPPPPSNNPLGILKIMARAEQEAIAVQRELVKLVGDENPMKGGIEDGLKHDQHHLDEMWQMMREEEHQELELGSPPEGTPEHEAMEPPEEEAAEEALGEEGENAEAPLEMQAKAAAWRMRKFAAESRGGRLKVASELSNYAPEIGGAGHLLKSKESCGVKTAADKEKEEYLKEKGVERAVSSLAAEAHRERARRGERFGQTLGSIGGAAGGALAGRKYVGGPVGTIGGGALGYLAGGKLGKELGTEADIAKSAAQAGPRVRGVYAVSPAQQKALFSNMVSSSGNWGGFGVQPTFGGMGGLGMKPSDIALLQSVGAFRKHGSIQGMAAAMKATMLKMAQEMGEMGGEAQAPMASPTADELEPANYLQAELAGRQAQEQNESVYYRQQLGTAQQQAAMAQQQMADTQAQLAQLQQQAQEAGAQVQAATQQAVAAQDAATQQSLEAAKARIGAQELRSKMLEIASQDPQALGEAAMAPPPPAPGMEQNLAPSGAGAEAPTAGEPATPEGPAGEAGGPATPPGGAPAGPPGAPGPGVGSPGGEAPGGGPGAAEAGGVAAGGGGPPMKTGGALEQHLLGAGVGTALGAGGSLYAGYRRPALAEKVQQLEASQTGGFLQAARLAAAKRGLAVSELAEAHPVASALTGGLAGGLSGAMSGPRLIGKAQETARNVRDAMR